MQHKSGTDTTTSELPLDCIGFSLFATELKIINIFKLEFVETLTGSYKYRSQKIPWSFEVCMIPVNVSDLADRVSYTWTSYCRVGTPLWLVEHSSVSIFRRSLSKCVDVVIFVSWLELVALWSDTIVNFTLKKNEAVAPKVDCRRFYILVLETLVHFKLFLEKVDVVRHTHKCYLLPPMSRDNFVKFDQNDTFF